MFTVLSKSPILSSAKKRGKKMRIDQLRLKNFKLFEQVTLDFKPITLLTGINSSGKSTILNAIASILQTPPPHMFPFDIVLNGENCSLGTYKDVSTNRSTKNNFGIGLTITDVNNNININSEFRYSPRGEHILPNSMEFSINDDAIRVLWTGRQNGYHCIFDAPSLKKLHSDKAYRAFLDSLNQYLEGESKKKGSNKVRLKLAEEMLSDTVGKEEWIKAKGLSSRDIIEKISSMPVGNHLVGNIRSFVHKFRYFTSYVGPIRAMPLRFYTPDQPHHSIDSKGINCAQLLNDWRKHQKDKFDLVAKLLAELELIDKIKTRSTADDILKVIVKPLHRDEESNFIDVGFGVSQALPFIVSDVSLPDNSVLCVNQPEVHLHPTSQAKLANHFVARCSSRQYIIETHSEYLINRLRLLVLKNQIDPDKIRILFFDSKSECYKQPTVHSIGVNKDGSLSNAPQEFFETYYSDSFELAMAGNSNG